MEDAIAPSAIVCDEIKRWMVEGHLVALAPIRAAMTFVVVVVVVAATAAAERCDYYYYCCCCCDDEAAASADAYCLYQ